MAPEVRLSGPENEPIGIVSLAEALRMAGRAAEAADMLQAASGDLAQGSPGWMEARWRLLRTLQQLDPVRAQAMLRQHMDLLPDGGPMPWGERFRQAAAAGSGGAR